MRSVKSLTRVLALAIFTAVLFFSVTGCTVQTEAIQIQKDKTSLDVGDRLPISFNITPEDATNQDIDFISTDPSVVKIEDNELVALNEGAVTIIALQDNYYFDAYTITVNPIMPERIFFSAPTLELGIGRATDLAVSMIPANASNKNVAYQSSDSAIAQIEGDSLVGLAEGTVTVTAKHESGITSSFTVNVSPVLLEGLTINGPDKLPLESTDTLEAVFSPEDVTDKAITWSTSSKSILSISEAGEITANKIGTATITATHPSGLTATKEIEVTPVYAEKIQLASDTLSTIYANESIKLTASVFPENTTDKAITWSSDNPSVATVKNGKVTGVAGGTTTIRATTTNDVEATYDVTVKDSIKTMTVSVSSSCSNYNHVGNEWGSYFSVNGKQVGYGDSVTVKLNGTISVYTEIIEYDKISDVGTGSYSMTVKRDYFEGGFYITQEIYVREGNGRYAGNTCLWTVKYTFS